MQYDGTNAGVVLLVQSDGEEGVMTVGSDEVEDVEVQRGGSLFPFFSPSLS